MTCVLRTIVDRAASYRLPYYCLPPANLLANLLGGSCCCFPGSSCPSSPIICSASTCTPVLCCCPSCPRAPVTPSIALARSCGAVPCKWAPDNICLVPRTPDPDVHFLAPPHGRGVVGHLTRPTQWSCSGCHARVGTSSSGRTSRVSTAAQSQPCSRRCC